MLRSALIASALAVAGSLTGCGESTESSATAPSQAAPAAPTRELDTRMVVIGIDGADWKVIDALAAVGDMPHLSGLRRRGVWGSIETLHDIPLSPAIWTSVATGQSTPDHGISWFLVDQPDGTRVPVQSSNRRTEAVWTILAREGLRSTSVGWWASYPAEDVGRGVVVSDALGFHGFGATAREGDDGRKTYPATLFPLVDALVPPEQQLPFEFVRRFVHLSEEEYRAERFDPALDPRRDPFNPIHLFQQYAVTAQGYTAIAESLLEGEPSDLFLVYFEQVDSLSHLFMKYAPPKLAWIDDESFARYRDVVTEWYRYQDELLGRLLAKIDLDTTAVVVLSDHGFKSGDRRILSQEVVDVRKAHLDHETHGIFVAAGPHVRQGEEVLGASVLDITPTVLHYLGLAVGKDMEGKVLEQILEPEFTSRHPIRYVSTYETGARDGVGAGSDVGLDPLTMAENEDAMRALGYLGDEPEGEDRKGESSSPEIHVGLGRVHLANGEPQKALKEYEQALALDENDAEALLGIGAVHQLQGRGDLAAHFAQRALQVDPNSIGALSQLAEIRRDEGNLEEAIRLFRLALSIDDSQPFLYQGLGDVLQRARRFVEAEEAFQSVLSLDPDSFRARYNLGVTYENMGRTDEAVARFEEALELDPDHPEVSLVHNNLGAILLDRRENDRALEHFEAAVAASPFNVEARYNAALLYLDEGRVDEAIAHLEDASQLRPDHHQVHIRLGMVYLGAFRNDEAHRCLLLVRRLHPQDWVATIGLAVLHRRAEATETAQQLLDEALASGGDAARALAASFPLLAPLLEE